MHSIVKTALAIGALTLPALVFAQAANGDYKGAAPQAGMPASTSASQDVGGTGAQGQAGMPTMNMRAPSRCVGPVSFCTLYFGS
jgi:hypothetical protein